MSKIVKIGVLGCAKIARSSFIPAIQSLPDKFELVAVASRSIAKASAFADEFNCKAIEGYENLIHSNIIDALYIPLPTGLHKEWIIKALKAGLHVYAEKSIASKLIDAEKMVSTAKSNDLALMEGYMFQYHSQHQIVLDLLRDGEIGAIRHFTSSFGFPPLGSDNFRYNETIGGGVLLDAAGYSVRAVHFILGSGFEVKGATLYIDPDLKTSIYGSAFLSNSKGIGASVSFGFDNYYQCRYEIWGETGKISAERAFTPKPNDSPKIIISKADGSNTIEVEPEDHFVKALKEFHFAIRNSGNRAKHYSEILVQSKSLDQIKDLSK